MPLNISIDVDDTLLGKDGKLAADAIACLRRLQAGGHCLQLWSLGGAEYAKTSAARPGVTEFFASFAKKPDLAIDDLPELAKPMVIIRVDRNHSFSQAVQLALETESTVDSVTTVAPALEKFIGQLQSEAQGIRSRFRRIMNDSIPLHPAPFFGAIQQARVITIGFNPSTSEFGEQGRWP